MPNPTLPFRICSEDVAALPQSSVPAPTAVRTVGLGFPNGKASTGRKT